MQAWLRESRSLKLLLWDPFPEKHRVMILSVVGVCWFILLKNRRRVFLVNRGFVCGNVYLLVRLVKGSVKLLRWTNLGARRGFHQSDRKQLASIPKRTVSMREQVVCGLQRGSSGHQVQPAWNMAVSSEKRTDDHNVEAGAGAMASKVWQT